MSYRVIVPKKVDKFIKSLNNSDSIYSKLNKLKDFNSKKQLNLDIKVMKGNWKGYYRLRIGDVRFIFRIVDNQIVFIEKGDFRGSIYK